METSVGLSNVEGRGNLNYFTFPSPQKNERTLESEEKIDGGNVRRTFHRQREKKLFTFFDGHSNVKGRLPISTRFIPLRDQKSRLYRSLGYKKRAEVSLFFQFK